MNPFFARLRFKPGLILSAVAIASIAAWLTLYRLGAAGVCGSNEAVEGVFVQQMVEHGKLLFPLENGRSPMYKPPLFHWTAAAIDYVTGIKKITAQNLRLPAALYAIAGVILTFCFSWDFLGRAGGWLTGLILCGSYQYIEQGRIGRVDMTLCFFETMALLEFMWWYAGKERENKSEASGQGASMGLPPNRTAMKMGPAVPQSTVRVMPESLPLTRGRLGGGHLGESPIFMPEETASGRSDSYRRGWLRYLFALALGLAVLAKGPVGAILPAAACGIFLLAERRFDDLREIAAPGPVLLAVLTGGSWYAACLLARRYGFLGRQLGSENFGRFFGALGTMPPWYYIKPLLLNSGPLSLMVPLAVFFALHTYWQHPSAPAPPDAPPLARDSDGRVLSVRAQDAVRLFAIFWLVSVAFFTVAAYKRRAYLLPLWPASAVLLAWWVQTSALSSPRWGRLLRGFLVISSCGLIIFNTVLLPQREVRECAGDSRKDAAMEIDRIVGRSEPLYLYGFGGEPAPLLFYLDRDAPPVEGKLGDAPPGYVIVPAPVWRQHQAEALDLTPVFQSTTGRPPIVLLRHGKALASQ